MGAEGPHVLNEAIVTQAMLEHAAVVGKRLSERQAVVSSERKLFQEDLSRDCHDGNLDACYMLAGHKSTPLLPGRSSNPDAYNAEYLAELEGLCKKQHPASCISLGISLGSVASLSYLYSQRQPTRPLVELVRSVTASAPIEERQRLEAIARREIARQNFDIPAKVLRQYYKACANGKAYACFAGEVARWDGHGNLDNPKVEAEYKEMGVRTSRVHWKVAASIYTRYGSKYTSLSEDCLANSFNLGLTTLDEYIHKLDVLCTAGDAFGCYMKGVKQSYVEENDDMWRSYEKACELGFMGGCMEMAEHLLALGEPQKALGYAVTACQKDWNGGCYTVLEKFGLSSEFVAPSTAKFLVNYACEREDEKACMDSYRLAFKERQWGDARRGFGRLCENQKNYEACRFAAQVAWSNSQLDDAITLLDKGCLYQDRDSCLEKAAAYAAKGDQYGALRILDAYCENAGSHTKVYSCNLANSLRKGFLPKRLSDIFKEPLDGSKNPILEASE
jgi:hypothetical protein